MKIESSLVNWKGQEFKVVYDETDPMADLEDKILGTVHAFCFYNGKMVIVNHPKGGWMPPGGGLEPGESIEDAVAREVHEETNMKVLYQKRIGFQDVFETTRTLRQVRSFCIVEPYGEFVADPDGEIQEIQLIDPKEYAKYFDWKKVGERVMERAFEFLDEYSKF